MDQQTSKNLILWYFLALLIVSCVLLGWLIWPFISTIILAAVVTGVFNPFYRYFCRWMKPSIASVLTCLLVFCILFIPIVFFIGILAGEAYDLYLMARDAVLSDQLKKLMQESRLLERANFILSNFNVTITGEELNRTVSEVGRVVGLFLFQQAQAIATNTLKFAGNFFFMLLIVFYLLIDGDRLVEFIVKLSPLPEDQDKKLIQKFKDMAGAILVGNGLGGLIQGTIGGILFAIFGIQSPFLWGVIMGLLAFLPIVGIGVVFIPAAVLLMLKGRIAAGIFFVVFYLFLSMCTEYLFKPKLVGSRVQMHTLLVFLSIIGGLKLFGILGIIYGPIVVTAFLTLTDIYHASYRRLVENEEQV
jgi:predicted PurR-regulated permease PerM